MNVETPSFMGDHSLSRVRAGDHSTIYRKIAVGLRHCRVFRTGGDIVLGY